MLKNFFKHPKLVGMTYNEHMKHSFRISWLMLNGSVKAFAHGLYPDIYITSSTDISSEINKLLGKSSKISP